MMNNTHSRTSPMYPQGVTITTSGSTGSLFHVTQEMSVVGAIDRLGKQVIELHKQVSALHKMVAILQPALEKYSEFKELQEIREMYEKKLAEVKETIRVTDILKK